jgi:hypothetical protein
MLMNIDESAELQDSNARLIAVEQNQIPFSYSVGKWGWDWYFE